MRAGIFIALLLGLAVSAPCARAQRDSVMPIFFTPLTPYLNPQYEWPMSVAVDSRGDSVHTSGPRIWQARIAERDVG